MRFLGLLPLLFLACGCQALVLSSAQRLPPFDFVHRVEMDQIGSYFLLWSPREKDVVFEVQVRTKGYIGLGFSSNGFMKDADIVIGWIDEKGVVHFSDRHAPGNRTPVEDDSQDYELLGGYTNSSHTVIRFSRPWITCDKKHDYPLTEDTARVLWAYDAVKPDPLASTLSLHDHRGSRSLYLKEPKMNIPPREYDGNVWDIRAPQVRISDKFDTLYWCKLYKIPPLPWKHQVIGFLPLIDPGSLSHVHHMLLYECNLRNSLKHLEKWVNESGAQCYNLNMPISWNSCDTPIVAWAIGSQGEMFPEDVGFPVGEEHDGADYFLLEIHYDNPDLKEGIIDSSGLRLLLTDKIRRYDAGVLTVGHKVEPSMMIPPQRLWTTRAHCTSDCTQKTIPKEGIRVFSGTLHAHLLGHSISLQHIRDGYELEPLIKDDNYDFNYQQARILSKERIIEPGDHLILNCRYNATHRRQPTFGGFGTEDEMCLAFLSYYPKVNLGICYSRPDISLLFVAFGIQDLYEVDKVMFAFDKDYFDESEIRNNTEYKNLNTMSQSAHAGEVAKPLKLVYYFKIVNVSEPESLRGKTFFDIVTSDSTWQDRNLISHLEEAVTKLQYEPKCFYNGRVLVQGLPKKANVPHFFDYNEVAESCQQLPNQSNRQQTQTFIPPVEEGSKFVQRKFTGTPGNSDEFTEESKKGALERNNGKILPAPTTGMFLFLLICLLNT